MLVQAAVTHSKGGEFKIEDVRLDAPRKGEILVRVVASGICHTDLGVRDQYKPLPLPAVLGHEGSGVVESVGEGVASVQPGDHVVVSFVSCGECKNCTADKPYACERFYKLNFTGIMPDGTQRIYQGDQQLSTFFGQSSFATYAVVSERSVVKVDKAVPLELLGPLGCGIQTGAGTVLNRLKPESGSSFAVFGCGTVGLSALLAAKSIGCSVIIGVDLHDKRLELAMELGATHTINAKEANPVEEILKITGEGVKYVIDTSGNPNVLRQSVDSLAQLGTVAHVGGAKLGTEVKLDMQHLLFERTVTGVIEGNSVPQTFIPQLIELYKAGKFPFDKLIKRYDFANINQAVHDMESGETIKPVIVISRIEK